MEALAIRLKNERMNLDVRSVGGWRSQNSDYSSSSVRSARTVPNKSNAKLSFTYLYLGICRDLDLA